MAQASATAGRLGSRRFVETRLGGSGGQGVILMGVILAVAAARDHRHVVQTQSYGPEARGGYSRADVIIANEQIDYPQLQGADLLVTLSDQAAKHYIGGLRRTGAFLYDSDEVSPPTVLAETYAVPLIRLAQEITGRSQSANILTLGAIVALTELVTRPSLERAVAEMVPKASLDLNLRAMEAGLALKPEEWRVV